MRHVREAPWNYQTVTKPPVPEVAMGGDSNSEGSKFHKIMLQKQPAKGSKESPKMSKWSKGSRGKV